MTQFAYLNRTNRSRQYKFPADPLELAAIEKDDSFQLARAPYRERCTRPQLLIAMPRREPFVGKLFPKTANRWHPANRNPTNRTACVHPNSQRRIADG